MKHVPETFRKDLLVFNRFNLIKQCQIRLLAQGHVFTFLLLQAKRIYSTAEQPMGSHISDLHLCSISLTWCLSEPPTHTQPPRHCPLCPPHAPPPPYLSFLTVDSFCLVNAAPFPVSLPLCLKRMQFLSLPQWCLAWSAPASTWCGATGGATPPRA